MRGPPNIIRKFNNFEISFRKGGKKEGDYLIDVNKTQVTDQNIFETLCAKIKLQGDAIKFLRFLWGIGKIEYSEEEAFNKINTSTFDDEIKTYLYVIWHRLIIDDINYPPPLNGRKRSLGQVYVLLAKKHNFKLPSAVKSLPQEVYDLGFPDGVEEKITTKTWFKIYDLYRDLLLATAEGCKHDYIKAGL